VRGENEKNGNANNHSLGSIILIENRAGRQRHLQLQSSGRAISREIARYMAPASAPRKSFT